MTDTDRLIAQSEDALMVRRWLVGSTPENVREALGRLEAAEAQLAKVIRERDGLLRQRWSHENRAHVAERGHRAAAARANDQRERAEAAEAQRDTLAEAIVQARRDLWWFIERGTAEGEWGFREDDVHEIVPRAMAIQDDVLGAALAGVAPPEEET